MFSVIKLNETFSKKEVMDTIEYALNCESEVDENDESANKLTKFPDIPLSVNDKDKQQKENSNQTSKENSLEPSNPSIAGIIAKESARNSKRSTPQPEFTVEEIMNNSDILEQAMKCCKFALSALEFEDSDTAIKELEEAIKLVKTHKDQKSNQS